MRQCMGGGCNVRLKCAHYFAAPTKLLPPSERLCEKGDEAPIDQRTVRNWKLDEVPAVRSVWDLAKNV